MSQITIKSNQAALILDVSVDGEVTVEAAFPEEIDDAGELAAAICKVIGQKLASDDDFQKEVMGELQNGSHE